jgi:addiction module HigA family antidote
MSSNVPTLAKAFPPGDFIREELEHRGWTQQQLAVRMGRPLQTVNMIVNGRKAITAETASQLETVFGPSAAYWMNLEAIWQLYKLAEKRKAAVRSEKSRATHKAKSGIAQPATPRRRDA